jgi:hypothetical protein
LAQEVDLTSLRQELGRKKDERDIQCAFRVNEETIWKLRKLAAQKHFSSVAHMMRDVTKDFLDKEENKVLW